MYTVPRINRERREKSRRGEKVQGSLSVINRDLDRSNRINFGSQAGAPSSCIISTGRPLVLVSGPLWILGR